MRKRLRKLVIENLALATVHHAARLSSNSPAQLVVLKAALPRTAS